jgi:tripartite-type tricarboxylate transporter receptor subunit TctC
MTTPLRSKLFRSAVASAAFVLLAAGAAGVAAQDFPNRPLRIVVGYPPGGGADIIAREFGQKLQEKLRQPVIVENKPGGGTLLAASQVAKAPADGYTLLLVTNTLLISPQLQGASPVDVLADIKPVASLTGIVFVLVTPASLPQKTLPELVGYMRANPLKVNYATPSQGGITHLIGTQFQEAQQVKMVTVPYKGTSPAIVDLIAGRVETMLDAVATSAPYIKDGRLRALGIADDKPWPGMPDVPPMFAKGETFGRGWYWLLTAAGAPDAAVKTLNTAIAEITAEPVFHAKLTAMALIPQGQDSPAKLRADMAAEYRQWGDLIREKGLKGE